MNKLYSEARCKIIWGESPDSVKEYLIESNLQSDQAQGILDALLEERYASVRKNGLRKLLKAIGILLACGTILFILCSNIESHSTYSTRRSAGAFALPAIGILWALWKGTDAILEISDPTKFQGDIGINTD